MIVTLAITSYDPEDDAALIWEFETQKINLDIFSALSGAARDTMNDTSEMEAYAERAGISVDEAQEFHFHDFLEYASSEIMKRHGILKWDNVPTKTADMHDSVLKKGDRE